jgi:hypothetical protein
MIHARHSHSLFTAFQIVVYKFSSYLISSTNFAIRIDGRLRYGRSRGPCSTQYRDRIWNYESEAWMRAQ